MNLAGYELAHVCRIEPVLDADVRRAAGHHSQAEMTGYAFLCPVPDIIHFERTQKLKPMAFLVGIFNETCI
jgi:hypothetical protein